jgi:hypothetical protein
MTYLVRVGFISGNLSRTGSRGYRVRRRGKIVETWWGGIEVEKRGSKTIYYWAPGWPKSKSKRQPSIKAAILHRESVLEKKFYPSRNYEKLPPGTRIRNRTDSTAGG